MVDSTKGKIITIVNTHISWLSFDRSNAFFNAAFLTAFVDRASVDDSQQSERDVLLTQWLREWQCRCHTALSAALARTRPRLPLYAATRESPRCRLTTGLIKSNRSKKSVVWAVQKKMDLSQSVHGWRNVPDNYDDCKRTVWIELQAYRHQEARFCILLNFC